jgi:hypothetical protein
VPAIHFAPDEPHFKKKITEGKDPTEAENKSAIMRPGLWGRVFPNFNRINPDRRPTILFAPGVPESLWFAEQFVKNGVPAAHVDGDIVWMDGKIYPRSSNPEKDPLNELRERSRDGSVCVVCNRFVMREGLDWPWLSHGVFATCYGSVSSYLQSVGRLMRRYPGLESKTVQDHGGNWHRFGSVNADREWLLNDTASIIAQRRRNRIRERRCRRCRAYLLKDNPVCPKCDLMNDSEPMVCPQCQMVLGELYVLKYGKCPNCSFLCRGVPRSRPVVMPAGDLVPMAGHIFRPLRICKKPNAGKLWRSMYYRSLQPKAKGRNFAQAAALFAMENKWGWPSRDLPLMPIDDEDYYRAVVDVPRDRLIQE